jgi:hypothetical protein
LAGGLRRLNTVKNNEKALRRHLAGGDAQPVDASNSFTNQRTSEGIHRTPTGHPRVRIPVHRRTVDGATTIIGCTISLPRGCPRQIVQGIDPWQNRRLNCIHDFVATKQA